MNQRSGFVLRAGLLVTGAWSAVLLVGVVAAFTVHFGGAALRIPAAEQLMHSVAYYTGFSSGVIALLSVFVGVPILARRHRAGFWRGLLAVVAAAAWFALSGWFFLALVGPALVVFPVGFLNLLIAVVLGVIIYRRRRAERLNPQRVGEVFS